MEDSNKYEPSQGETYLREIRDAVVGIHDILQQSKKPKAGNEECCKDGMRQHRKMQDVLVTKNVILYQLKIANSTLAKWRYRKCLKYRNQGSRMIVYSYMDLMDALADNKLTARGFNPFYGYKRMLEWYHQNVGNPCQQ